MVEVAKILDLGLSLVGLVRPFVQNIGILGDQIPKRGIFSPKIVGESSLVGRSASGHPPPPVVVVVVVAFLL